MEMSLLGVSGEELQYREVVVLFVCLFFSDFV